MVQGLQGRVVRLAVVLASGLLVLSACGGTHVAGNVAVSYTHLTLPTIYSV